MKKTASNAALSKLTLNRETLSELTSNALEKIGGGKKNDDERSSRLLGACSVQIRCGGPPLPDGGPAITR